MATKRGETVSVIQSLFRSKRPRPEVSVRAERTQKFDISTTSFGNAECGDASFQDIMDRIERSELRTRLLHDIIPYQRSSGSHVSPEGSDGEEENFRKWKTSIRSRFAQKSIEKFTGSVLFYREHFEKGYEHIHVVHDCTFSNSSCRCSIMAGLQIKPRERRRKQFTGSMGSIDWKRLTEYLLFSEDGGTSWVRTHDGTLFCSSNNPATRLRGIYKVAGNPTMEEQDREICARNWTPLPGGSGSVEDNLSQGFTSSQKASGLPKNFQEGQILKFLLHHLVSPPESCYLLPMFIEDKHLLNINDSQKEYKFAISLYKRIILNKTLSEIFNMYEGKAFIYNAINGNSTNHYFSVEDSAYRIEHFLLSQFDDQETMINFVITLFNLLNKCNGKKNCIWIRGPPDSYKSTFVKIIEQLMISSARVSIMNKTNNFPFSSCTESRLIILDELSYDPLIYTDQLKMLLSGEPLKVSKKYCDDVFIYKTPIIAVSNGECFPNTEVFNVRVEKFIFKQVNVNLVEGKYCHPLGLMELFKKFGCI